jgi:soluble lytic murein transglycosylase-like protein
MRAQRHSSLTTRLLPLILVCPLLVLLGTAPASAGQKALRVASLATQADAGSARSTAAGRSLQTGDLALYRRLFALQERGAWDEADRLIPNLKDRLLLGHLQAQRYLHPTAYISTYGELARWLDSYGDLPQATRIHKLAMKRRPAGAQGPQTPLASRDPFAISRSQDVTGWQKLDGVQFASLSLDQDFVFEIPARETPEPSLSRDEEILHETSRSWEKRGAIAPRQNWNAGLAAYRLGRFPIAARHFTAVANDKEASGEDVAAGAFWAARAWAMMRRPELEQRFLRIAASASDGFYGSIAKTLLGQSPDLDWSGERTTSGPDPELLAIPAARRALALSELDQSELAAQELSLLAGRVRPQLADSVLVLAAELSLPAAELRAAQLLRKKDGRQHAAGLFPAPKWKPAGGFTVDRALLWAIARAESGFDAGAVSPKGAVGLMQIMPDTAASVAAKMKIPYSGNDALLHPETNLRIGQAYIQKLRRLKQVGDSLIHLFLAYNAGIGRVETWMRDMPELANDPLLFLESVPLKEPRQYVKGVLVNLWTYRARLGQPSPSLEQIAANEWPVFEAVEIANRAVADARKS